MRRIGPRLVDLDPRPVRYSEAGPEPVKTIAEAQGVEFACPRCRYHRVVAWFLNRGVPDRAEPEVRHGICGMTVADLTLLQRVDAGCWRGNITGGWISTQQ